MFKNKKNWILTALRPAGTAVNGIFFIIAIVGYIWGPYRRSTADVLIPLGALTLCLLNTLLIWSPLREFFNYFTLRMRRYALEDQRKIDELEIVELDHPV